MIYDCFSFFNELDILEIRLNTLNEVVDKFVLVEAPWTHTGHPKPLYFEENKQRFAPFLDKIIHIVASEPPVSPDKTDRENAWIRENWQRNQIVRGLSDAKPDDILIIADLDEIPDPKILQTLSVPNNVVFNCILRYYGFYLNYHNVAYPNWAGGPQLLNLATFTSSETYKQSSYTEECPQNANSIPSATLIRFIPNKKSIKNAGWHFSSIGGVQAVQKKIASFAHTEFTCLVNDPEKLKKIILSGKGFFGFGDRFMPEPLQNGFPQFLVDNADRFSNLLLPADMTNWRRTAFQRAWFRSVKSVHDKFIAFAIRATPRPLIPLMRKIRELIKI